MADIEVLKERVETLKERVDCLEDKVESNRSERREDIGRLFATTDKLREHFMEIIAELKAAFTASREELLKGMNGILIKTLVAVFSVFGATIIGLIVWIYTGQIKP
jgi:hypothetical protein